MGDRALVQDEGEGMLVLAHDMVQVDVLRLRTYRKEKRFCVSYNFYMQVAYIYNAGFYMLACVVIRETYLTSATKPFSWSAV